MIYIEPHVTFDGGTTIPLSGESMQQDDNCPFDYLSGIQQQQDLVLQYFEAGSTIGTELKKLKCAACRVRTHLVE
jgi:hypothetical protein